MTDKMPDDIYISRQFGLTMGFEPYAGAVKYIRADLCAKDDSLPNALAMIEEMAAIFAELEEKGAADIEDVRFIATEALTRYETFRADVTAKAGG